MANGRIFGAFLIIVTAALLWLVPITDLVYSFETDVKTDSVYKTTGVAETGGNLTLTHELYDDDASSVEMFSDLESDVPVFVSYNGTTRVMVYDGLIVSENRTLEVQYDTDALNASSAWTTILDKVPLIWMILIIVFPVAGLLAILSYKGIRL